MMACVIFMIINIYGLYYYYYYCSEMDGASRVHCLWTYGVWVLIPNGFGHYEFRYVAIFQFQALTDEIWVILAFCSSLAEGNQNKMLFS